MGVKQLYNPVPRRVELVGVSLLQFEAVRTSVEQPAEWDRSAAKDIGIWGQYVAVYPVSNSPLSHNPFRPFRIKCERYIFLKKCVRSSLLLILFPHVYVYSCIWLWLYNKITTLTIFCKEAGVTIEASYVIAWNIARSKRPYTGGGFIKEHILQVASIFNPSKKKFQRLISQIALSRQTIVRRIGDLGANVTILLKNNLVSWVAFWIALDESTDVQDKPQLVVIVLYMPRNFCVKESLLDLVAVKDTIKGVDIKNAIDSVLSKNIPLNVLLNL